jgi:multicomponent K+:H+ antiporter subunit A
VHLPFADFELASAMAFDLGVYLVVVGATLLILVHMGLMHGATHAPEPRAESGSPGQDRPGRTAGAPSAD